MHKNILKEYSSLFHSILYLFDWGTIALSAVVSYRVYRESWHLSSSYILIIVIAILLCALIFPRFDLYRPWRARLIIDEARMLMFAWAFSIFLLLSFLFVTKMGATYSRGWVGTWLFIGFAFLILERICLRLLLRFLRSRGINQESVIVVGMAELMNSLIKRIEQMPWTGFRIVGVFKSDNGQSLDSSYQSLVLGNWNEVGGFLQERNVADQVWIVMPLREEEKLKTLLHDLRHIPADIRYFPDLFGVRILNHSFSEIVGFPVMNLSVSPMHGVNRFIKAFEDRALALFFLLLAFPVMLFVAIGVKITSPGPIFYRQERVGWNGNKFMIIKFRTMPVDLEDKEVCWGQSGKKPTRFGRFLRKTSLDELPQFLNVLKGEMSIVGPRPERPIFVEKFKDEIPGYMQKHLVKAGITGWAQVHGWRGDTDLAKRVEFDLFYIENWSLFFDIRIILMTVFKGFWSKTIS